MLADSCLLPFFLLFHCSTCFRQFSHPLAVVDRLRNEAIDLRLQLQVERDFHRRVVDTLTQLDELILDHFHDQLNVIQANYRDYLSNLHHLEKLKSKIGNINRNYVNKFQRILDVFHLMEISHSQVLSSSQRIIKELAEMYWSLGEPELANRNPPPFVHRQGLGFDLAMNFAAKNWKGASHLLKELEGDPVEIARYSHYVKFQMGYLTESLAICQRAMIRHKNLTQDVKEELNEFLDFYKFHTDQYSDQVDSIKYEKFCKNFQPQRAIKGWCRLDNRNNHPLLILQPVKEEIVSLQPRIMKFHQLLTLREIEHFKRLSADKFIAGRIVQSGRHMRDIDASVRQAQVAWIPSAYMGRLVDKIEAYTGLDASSQGSENFQVARYTVGGHYSTHFDALMQPKLTRQDGDRIATLLMYLIPVESGGETSFPSLGIRIDPDPGSGLFWFNLHHSNESVDLATSHCACPVISGTKWISNKWFRMRGQFRTLPCDAK